MTLILIVLILVLCVGGGGWGYSRYPSSGPYLGGGVGLVLLIVVLWAVLGGGRL